MRDSNSAPAALTLTARDRVRSLVASRIREVANAGMGDPEILAFWFGEPDEVTPTEIRDAATASLAAGETFYCQNLGLAELRIAIGDYVSRLHAPIDHSRIAVTASGMSALMLAMQAICSPGDRVVCVTPLWPNLTEIPKILGANVVRVALDFTPSGWTLDVDKLCAALTPDTRALVINSPNNPTGWTITAAAQQRLLEHCRRHGTWIVSDDVYERLYYRAGENAPGASVCAPSLLACSTAEDRVISTNSFSKAWLMTGWRLGWIVAPEAMIDDLAKLIEYNTSCSPVFVQRGGVVALTSGEPTVARTLARFTAARNLLVSELQRIPGVETAAPDGAMYAFFRVARFGDSLALCKRLVREARLGLAPGSAFGPEGEGFVRWCFAASDARLHEGIARFSAFMSKA